MTAGREQSDAAFYFDLESPLAYLAAERVLQMLPVTAEWQPVLAAELPDATPYSAFRCEHDAETFRENVARRAEELDLQPLRWPRDFPFDSRQAMLVATYAKSIGRTVPFVQAAFRQAFAGGRSLAGMDNVLIAAAACEMHPRAVLKGATLASTAAQLAGATASAVRVGVTAIPAVRVGTRVFSGEYALERAIEHAGATLGASGR